MPPIEESRRHGFEAQGFGGTAIEQFHPGFFQSPGILCLVAHLNSLVGLEVPHPSVADWDAER
jgi:hypothetical protein